MKFSTSLLLGFCWSAAITTTTNAFVVSKNQPLHYQRTTSSTTSSSTSLHAIGVLAKKAKQADLRKLVSDGKITDGVMEHYNTLKKAQLNDTTIVDLLAKQSTTPGPLQQELTRRAGTITVIAEYKRKNQYCDGGIIKEIYDPEILSPTFREYGASGIAVLADERMGGCTYDDLRAFCVEQSRARNEVPGPVPVINSDLIIDELQIAQSKACGAKAVVLTYNVLVTPGDDDDDDDNNDNKDELTNLLKAAAALELEAIVAVSSKEEAQGAIDAGARMLSVVNVDGADNKAAVIADLNIPEGQPVCMIANIIAKDNKGLAEIEECWAVRDKGFQCAWIGDALYKSGLETETPGAIIKSMKSKSSLKWASPKASHGRGEGAREYLGDILM